MHKQGDMSNEAVQAATVSDSGLTIYVSPFSSRIFPES